MHEEGTVINDFAEIKFSTQKLYLADKGFSGELYSQYLEAVRNKNIFSSKNAFR